MNQKHKEVYTRCHEFIYNHGIQDEEQIKLICEAPMRKLIADLCELIGYENGGINV